MFKFCKGSAKACLNFNISSSDSTGEARNPVVCTLSYNLAIGKALNPVTYYRSTLKKQTYSIINQRSVNTPLLSFR